MKLEIPSASPKDLATLHRWLLEAFRRSGNSFGGNVVRRVAVGTTETRIAHGLTERPLTTFWSQDGVTRVGRTRADDNKFVYLQASTATLVDILVIPGTAASGDVLDIVDETNAPAPVDASSGLDAYATLRGFRTQDQAGAFVSGVSRFHVAGINSQPATYFSAVGIQTAPGIGTGQMAYCIPEYFEKSGTITRLVTKSAGTTGVVGTPRLRIGVYADAQLSSGALSGSPYPGALIGESASLDSFAGGFAIIESFDLNIPVSAGTYVWFTIMFNDQAVTNQNQVLAYSAAGALRSLWPFAGFTLTTGGAVANDAASGCVGWRNAVTFGTTESCPSPFPQTAPVLLTEAAVGIPLIGYGFQQS